MRNVGLGAIECVLKSCEEEEPSKLLAELCDRHHQSQLPDHHPASASA